jgi:hypothetical protein
VAAGVAGSILLACGRFSKEDKKEGQAERLVVIAKQYTELNYALGEEG